MAALAKVSLSASYGCAIDSEGSYLIHCEHDGNPHCVLAACTKNSDAYNVLITDGIRQWRCDTIQLQAIAAGSIDRLTMVTYKVHESGTIRPHAVDNTRDTQDLLLEMLAGGDDISGEEDEQMSSDSDSLLLDLSLIHI